MTSLSSSDILSWEEILIPDGSYFLVHLTHLSSLLSSGHPRLLLTPPLPFIILTEWVRIWQKVPHPGSAMKDKQQTEAAQPDKEIKVDEEFAGIIPPLSKEELQRLEISLLEEGCHHPLIVWKDENILLDGHHRLPLCRKHNIPFKVTHVELPDRAAARAYVVSLQLARRNLTREAAAYLRGKRYEAEKKPLGGDRTTSEGALDQNDPLSTAQRLAAEFKVGEATIKRDEQFAVAVDIIVQNCGPDVKNLILSRDTGLTQGQVMKLAKMKPAEQKKFIQTLKEEGKSPRRKRKATHRASITLPTERKALVEKLISRLGRDEAAEVAKLLTELLRRKPTDDKK
jgi:hypothetical protein